MKYLLLVDFRLINEIILFIDVQINCDITALEKTTTNTCSYFMAQKQIYVSRLNLSSTNQRSSAIQCAMECLLDKRCWYHRTINENSNVQCLMYDSTVAFWNAMLSPDESIYKWMNWFLYYFLFNPYDPKGRVTSWHQFVVDLWKLHILLFWSHLG